MENEEQGTETPQVDQAGGQESMEDSFSKFEHLLDEGFEKDEDLEAGATKADSKSAVEVVDAEVPKAEAKSYKLSDNLTIKAGDKIGKEHLEAFEKGQLRMADYTQKTQEVAALRNEAQEFINARDQILKNPASLREFLNDEHILAAYQPQELLNIALHNNGVDPKLWSDFLGRAREEGLIGQNQTHDPYAQHFGKMNQTINQLAKRLESFEGMTVKEKQQAQHQAEISSLDSEVKGALSKHKDVDRGDLLVRLQHDTTNRSVDEIAKEMQAKIDRSHDLYLKRLKQNKTGQIKQPSGSSVPIMPSRPKTWAEADEALEGMAGAGLLG